MPFGPSASQGTLTIDPNSLSATPVVWLDAETGVQSAGDNTTISSVQNRAVVGSGSDATTFRGSFRTGTNLVNLGDLHNTSWWGGTQGPAINSYPVISTQLMDLLVADGVKAVRFLFSWEALQKDLSGPFSDTGINGYLTYYQRFRTAVDNLLARGLYIQLAMFQQEQLAGGSWNTAPCYKGVYIGSGSVTASAFADFWGKFATAFSYSNDNRIAFDLINEPHDLVGGVQTWFTAAQAAITAIRNTGATNTIMVPGGAYFGGSDSWVSSGSAARFLLLTDPASNLMATVHNYGVSGSTDAGNDCIGNMSAAISHARANNYKINVGEIAHELTTNEGVSLSSGWSAWQNFCLANTDVIASWLWWGTGEMADASGGSWWGTQGGNNSGGTGAGRNWGLTIKSGSVNADSFWMTAIKSTFTSIPVSGAQTPTTTLITNTTLPSACPVLTPAATRSGTKHGLTFGPNSKIYLHAAKQLTQGLTYFAAFKTSSTRAINSQPVNCPQTLFGYNSSGAVCAAGLSNGIPRYVYGTVASSVPSAPIAFTKNSYSQTTSSEPGVNNYIYVPTAYDSTHQTPISLFVWLHGCGGVASGDIGTITLGSSQSYLGMTVGGREGLCWQQSSGSVVMNAISDIRTKFNINPRKIVIGGYSSGGDIGYITAFQNSSVFSGAIFNNTDPFLIGWGANSIYQNAENKFNLVQISHTSDATYPIAYSNNSMALLSAAGYPTTHIERPGFHSGGTVDSDLRTLGLPYLDAGWQSPAPSTQNTYEATTALLNDSKLHTLAFTHTTSGVLRIYVDGVLSATHTGVSYISNTLINEIGAGYLDADCFEGTLAESLVYSGTLSDSEIRNLSSRAFQSWA